MDAIGALAQISQTLLKLANTTFAYLLYQKAV
jgi:hypothetical protein